MGAIIAQGPESAAAGLARASQLHPVESATVERSAPGLPGFARRALALPADTIALWALVALCVVAVVGFFTWVTYPNYDSYYALLWGDELLHRLRETPEWRYVEREVDVRLRKMPDAVR